MNPIITVRQHFLNWLLLGRGGVGKKYSMEIENLTKIVKVKGVFEEVAVRSGGQVSEFGY